MSGKKFHRHRIRIHPVGVTKNQKILLAIILNLMRTTTATQMIAH